MKRILIVDDSQKWVDFHKIALRKVFAGKEIEIETVLSAREGVEELELFQDEPFDIILTDMQMEADFLPLMAGEWFIRQIQLFKEYKNSKIVIISAAPDIAQIAARYGVDYIPKYYCQMSGAYDKIGAL